MGDRHRPVIEIPNDFEGAAGASPHFFTANQNGQGRRPSIGGWYLGIVAHMILEGLEPSSG
jgi:hypothetical protein